MIPNPLLSIKEGAIEPFTRPHARVGAERSCSNTASSQQASTSTSPSPTCRIISRTASSTATKAGEGIKGFFEWLETKKYKLHVRVFLAKYRGYTRCPDCDGQRLRQEARDVKIGMRSLPEIVEMSIADAHDFFDEA